MKWFVAVRRLIDEFAIIIFLSFFQMNFRIDDQFSTSIAAILIPVENIFIASKSCGLFAAVDMESIQCSK